MPDGEPSPHVARKLVCTVIGVLLFAASLTVLFLGMRAVMDIGGACASGGPYVPRQECPDGTWLIPVSIFTGLIGTALVVVGGFSGGPQLWTLAWPALFCSLGWNFLEYGVDPPPPETGLVWGWLICAVVFFVMGGLPLLAIVANAQTVLWGSGGRPPTPRAAASTLRDATRRRGASPPARPAPDPPPTTTQPWSSSTTSTVAAEPPGDADDSLVSDLERLSALHAAGRLTDDEYARAKAARLAQEDA